MRKALDVVALDHQLPASHVDLGHAGGTTGFIQVALIQQRIGLLQHRQHGTLFFAANGAQGKSATYHAEQRALAADLVQKVLEAPGADLAHLLLQGFQRQGVFAIAQQVVHQQFFGERFEIFRQLGEKHPEVFQHAVTRQWLASLFDANAGAINQVQLAVLAQQVVQVQVFLPQALGVHLRNRAQRFGEHRGLLIGQRRQVFDSLPGIGQAFGALDEFE